MKKFLLCLALVLLCTAGVFQLGNYQREQSLHREAVLQEQVTRLEKRVHVLEEQAVKDRMSCLMALRKVILLRDK